jgi:hypothetical protein
MKCLLLSVTYLVELPLHFLSPQVHKAEVRAVVIVMSSSLKLDLVGRKTYDAPVCVVWTVPSSFTLQKLSTQLHEYNVMLCNGLVIMKSEAQTAKL